VNLPRAYTIGVATHTGWVRVNNEDDFLVASAPVGERPFVVCAIADGMGGAAGGAEASRLGLRALAAALLDGPGGPLDERPVPQRIEAGFAAAAARVHEEAETVPALRGMGTTMSALCLQDGTAHLGHVGDTRIYRWRDGSLEQLTTDHAVREPHNLLTRCVGGGHATCEADRFHVTLRAGDRFLLATDGVWAAVPPAALAKLVGRGEPQAAADALVAQALRAGGNDNATVVVVDVVDPALEHEQRAVDLPRDERPGTRQLWARAASLRSSPWPFVLWGIALVLLAIAALQWAGIDGFWT